MPQWADIVSVNRFSSQISMILAATFVKGLLVFALVALFVSKTKRLSPTHRHLFWFFSIAGCLLIPPLALVSPPLKVENSPLSGALGGAFRAIFTALTPRGIGIENPMESEVIGRILDLRAAWQGTFAAPAAGGSAAIVVSAEARDLSRLSIAFWALCAWGAGAAFFLSSILSSALKLGELLRGAHPMGETPAFRVFASLDLRAGARRKVKLLTSGRCMVPFTCGVIKPVILLPTAADLWPEERLRAVLTHELAHVRRMDYLTQLVSRVVCALFWFLPHLWLAHGRLHVEQEKAADAFTVSAGTKPSDYALYLIDLVRVLRRTNLLLAGLFAQGNRKSTLERRVVDILRIRSGRDKGDSCRFLTPRFLGSFALCLLCAFPLLLLNPVSNGAHRGPFASAAFEAGARAERSRTGFPGAEGDSSVAGMPVDPAEAFGRIAGIWIRAASSDFTDYFCTSMKFVVHSEGSAEFSSGLDAMGPHSWGFYEADKAWIGREGYLYCQVRRKRISSSRSVTTELWRLDPSGKVLEIVFMNGTQDEFPDRIDPSLAEAGYVYYVLYTRGGERTGPVPSPADPDAGTSPSTQNATVRHGR